MNPLPYHVLQTTLISLSLSFGIFLLASILTGQINIFFLLSFQNSLLLLRVLRKRRKGSGFIIM
jgi:hypothetical protein